MEVYYTAADYQLARTVIKKISRLGKKENETFVMIRCGQFPSALANIHAGGKNVT